MRLDPRTPVLVGSGQVTARANPDRPLVDRSEPVGLMAEAVRRAAADCGPGGAGDRLLARAQSLRVVLPVSWRYANPGLLVTDALRIDPAEQILSTIGGNTPQTLVAQTALAIGVGQLDVAVVTGGESLFTLRAARRHQDRPVLPWTNQPAGTAAPDPFGSDRSPSTEVEQARGLDRPTTVFPLFENALRAASGATVAEHQVRISELWARFSAVAQDNPHAWSPVGYDGETIRTVGAANPMVTFPYPKLMCANDHVDQGAGLILCSADAAASAGVPRERWVFPVGAADAHDHWFLTHRMDLASSPAIAAAGRRALHLAGAGIDDVALLDLYSCAPAAVQLAASALGVDPMDPARPPTVTGGLTFAGAPAGNYVTHAIATMAGRLRQQPESTGLVTGLGGYATRHAAGVWSASPPTRGFRWESAQPDVDALPQRAPASDHDGDVTVETYTVVHDRQGEPQRAVLALLTDDGRRAWGTATDADTLRSLVTDEGCGRSARLHADGRTDIRDTGRTNASDTT